MKITLYMAMSADGYIAKLNNQTPWSDEEWQSYKKAVEIHGDLIVGRRTYEIMTIDKTLTDLGNPLIIVVSKKQATNNTKNIYFVKSCREAINMIAKLGFKTALLGGGTQLNTSFLKANLVDEVIIDLEPVILG